MINFYDQVPSIYTSASRDFQYLSWLINIVLNSVKHNVDDMYDLPNVKNDPRLVTLLAMTLGFKVKRNYDQKQLAALVSIIPSILKYKGTTKAIEMAGEALITAAGSAGTFTHEIKDNTLEIYLPKELVDVTLFIDLLPYILPAGISYRIVRKTKIDEIYRTEVDYTENVLYAWHKDLTWDASTKTSGGLNGLINMLETAGDDSTLANEPDFANMKDNKSLNIGLLDNNVIPVLDKPLYDPGVDAPTNNRKDEE